MTQTSPILDYFPLEHIREKQSKALLFIEKSIAAGITDIVIEAPTGCHEPSQRVIRYDGTLVRADRVRPGDLLMGPDSSPRRVQSLIRGTGEMFTVTPTRGAPFVVNKDHILALVLTPNRDYVSVDGRTIVTAPKAGLRRNRSKMESKVVLSVEDYLLLPKCVKHLVKLYKTNKVDFVPDKNLPLPPWILGAWLGDGSSRGPALTSMDSEIISEWCDYGNSMGLWVRVERKPCKQGRPLNKASTYCLTSGPNLATCAKSGRYVAGQNPITEKLRSVGVLGKKHIPLVYLRARENDRLELLAGLIDTDGSLSGSNTMDFTSVSRRLSDDVAFLAASLGLRVAKSERLCKCQNGGSSWAYRVHISGDTARIPVRLARKKATDRRQKKNPLRAGFTVQAAGVGRYCGWELDGDRLYLLDDFTVTHNSGKSGIGLAAGLFKSPAFYFVTQKLLQDQLAHDFRTAVVDAFKDDGKLIKSACEYRCPVKGNCEVGRLTKQCGLGKECAYRRAKIAFNMAPVGITNYAYYFTEKTCSGKIQPRKIAIFDECHNLAEQMIKFNEASVSDSYIKSHKLQDITVPRLSTLADHKRWVEEEYLPACVARRDVLLVVAGDESSTAAAGLTMHIDRMKRALGKIDRSWVFWQEDTDKGRVSNASPTHAYPFFHELIATSAPIRIYMSAFPGSKDIFCKNIGLDPNKTAWQRLRSPFKIENRRITFIPSGSMGRKSAEKSIVNMVKVIEKLAEKHKGQRGIIHCQSYWLGQELHRLLRQTDLFDRLLFPENADQRDKYFKQHCESDDTILLSPSFAEGYDFKDDLCRWQLIVKIPYPSLSNKVVAARKDEGDGWYDLQAVMKLVQTCGRAVRNGKDWAETYILDSDFGYLKKKAENMFPKWWTEALCRID